MLHAITTMAGSYPVLGPTHNTPYLCSEIVSESLMHVYKTLWKVLCGGGDSPHTHTHTGLSINGITQYLYCDLNNTIVMSESVELFKKSSPCTSSMLSSGH